MGLFDRKVVVVILKPNPLEKTPIVTDKSAICLSCTQESCPSECGYVPSTGPFYPPPPPSTITIDHKYHMPFYFIAMLCVVGVFFGFIFYVIMARKYRSNVRNRRNVPPQLNENREDFLDENVGPVLDHPIWYIRTVGFPQEIIDSITVFRYKKDESLIEGTDCSVCLSEFEEDESLRLLPKCSHAFHIPCIDTWLRSHKNCPLCRAPIVSNVGTPQLNNAEVSVIDIGDSSPNDEVVNQVENHGRHDDELENLESGEERNDEMRRGVENLDDPLPNDEGRMMDLLMKIPRLLDENKKGVRVFSDLAENHRVKVNKESLQPARRSVSMDSSAAQVIHLEMNLGEIVEGCCSNSDDHQLAEGNKGSLDITSKKGNRNSSMYKAMKSSSFGRSLQKVPICMKRSFSTSGKCSLPTTSKIQDLRQTM